jgi:hypothetical protein
MTIVCFENKNLPYDHENEWLHSYELNEWLVVPNIGDIVEFDDDAYYEDEKRETIGTLFTVVAKAIHYSRMDGCRDDCIIHLTVEPYAELSWTVKRSGTGSA